MSLVGEAPKRGSQPPWSRKRKKGRRAGMEAVMSARLVSMSEVIKPMLKVGSAETTRPKRPWAKMTRRAMDVMVTLGVSIDS